MVLRKSSKIFFNRVKNEPKDFKRAKSIQIAIIGKKR